MEILVELVERMVAARMEAAARGDDEVVGPRRTTHHGGPSVLAPRGEDRRQRRVHGHEARLLTLRV
jgi:hypothetical protein